MRRLRVWPPYVRTSVKLWLRADPSAVPPIPELRDLALTHGPRRLDRAVRACAAEGSLTIEHVASRLGRAA